MAQFQTSSAASQASKFITAASNFLSAISGGVDPRTGLYNINMPLGKIVGNNGLGPTLPLTLQYSPLNQIDFGFGEGCTLGYTSYRADPRYPKLLMLSTGEQYGADSSDVLRLHALKTFVFLRESNGGQAQFRIAHKNGSIEILRAPMGEYYYVPHKLITETGQSLTLTWKYENGMPRLQRVLDDTATPLLDIAYNKISEGNWSVVLTVLPDNTKEGYTATIALEGNLMRTLILRGDQVETREWRFDRLGMGQGNHWGMWLTGMQGPGGYKEAVTYDWEAKGMRFPVNFPNVPPGYRFPCVQRFEQYPQGQQPKMVSTYEYSEKDYLGYESGATATDYQDTLLGSPFSDYEYYSVQTQLCGQGDVVTKRTYNDYHLLTKTEIVRKGVSSSPDTTTRTTIVYPLFKGRHLLQQPTACQLPSVKTVEWVEGGNSRSEKTSTWWDEYANCTKKQAPDLLITSWDFYDASLDYYGFKRFVKTKTVDPFDVVSSYKDTEPQKIEYEYEKYLCMDGSGLPFVYLNSKSSQYSGTTLLEVTTLKYDNSRGIDTGRLKERSTTHYPAGASGAKYTSKEEITTTVITQDNALEVSHSLTTYDNLNIVRTETSSRLTGRAWKVVDPLLNVVTYTYDAYGRTKQHTWNPGTEYEHYEKTEYLPPDNQDGAVSPFQTIRSDKRRNKIKDTFDAHGRHIRQEVNDIDNDGVKDIWYLQRETTYDELGRVQSSTVKDRLKDSVYSLTETEAYDQWGQAKTSSYDDGVVDYTIHNPIALTSAAGSKGVSPSTGQKENSGTVLTTYDLSKKPILVQRFEAAVDAANRGAAYSTMSYEYDGLRRLRYKKDEGGNVTRYTYDNFGRATVTTYADGTIVNKEYSPDTSESLVSKIEVTGALDGPQNNGIRKVTVGTRTFDGLGRVRDKTVGGRKWVYEYHKASATQPSSMTPPTGPKQNYTYDDRLGEKLKSVTLNNSVVRSFNYFNDIGLVKQANAGNSIFSYGVHPSGRVLYEEAALDKSGLEAEFEYTVGGQLASFTHVDASVRTTERNKYGQVSSVTDDDMSVAINYDPLGRSYKWRAANESNTHTSDTVLKFDAFGREIERLTADNGTGQSLRITQKWNVLNQVISREVFQGSNLLRKETYQYTNRNRLSRAAYSAGQLLPTDQFGFSITEQVFEYDALGNVRMVTTSYANGLSNRAEYFFENKDDPCQLTRVTNSDPRHPLEMRLQYDGAGRLLNDGTGGLHFGYDDLGLLASASNDRNQQSAQYGYDAYGRLYKQAQSGEAAAYFYYRANQLVNLIKGEDRSRLLRSQVGTTSQFNVGQSSGVWHMGTDNMGSVLMSSDGSSTENRVYSAYGEEKL